MTRLPWPEWDAWDEYNQSILEESNAHRIDLKVHGDGAWPDLEAKPDRVHWQHGFSMCGLTAGMESGRPSVAIRIDLPDGRVVVAECSLGLLEMAVRALRAAHPEPAGSSQA